MILLLVACKVNDAPEDLESVVVFGMENFDSRSGSEAAVEALRPAVRANREGLLEGLRVADLPLDDLEAFGGGEAEAAIVGSAAMIRMESGVDDVARAWSHPHMDEVLDGTDEFSIVSEEGEVDCFLAHECEEYAYDGHRVLDMSVFGMATQDFRREFRWVVDGDRPVLLVRELIPGETDISSGLIAVHQQYSYSVICGDEGAVRVDTFWIDAEALGIDLPDAFALDFAVSGMRNTAAQVDAWVAANPE